MAALRLHFQDHPQLHKHTLPEVAQWLSLLVQIAQPHHILEIGTFIGYSTLAMALVMPPSCRLTTCDKDEDLAAQAQIFWEKTGKSDRIIFKAGLAQETLDHLEKGGESADFIYIDADKRGYDAYYEAALRLCSPGGLIVLDNMLSAGQLIHPVHRAYVKAIQVLNRKIHQDSRVDMLLLPLGDGVTVARKR